MSITSICLAPMAWMTPGVLRGQEQLQLDAELLLHVLLEALVARERGGLRLDTLHAVAELGVLLAPAAALGAAALPRDDGDCATAAAAHAEPQAHRAPPSLDAFVMSAPRVRPGRSVVERDAFVDLAFALESVDLLDPVLVERVRRAVEDDLAHAHADDPVTIGPRGVECVKVADHRDAVVAVDGAQDLHHPRGAGRIERGDRLVGEQDLRLLHQRPGDRHPLLLAARERVAALEDEGRHLDPLERHDRERPLLRRPQLAAASAQVGW